MANWYMCVVWNYLWADKTVSHQPPYVNWADICCFLNCLHTSTYWWRRGAARSKLLKARVTKARVRCLFRLDILKGRLWVVKILIVHNLWSKFWLLFDISECGLWRLSSLFFLSLIYGFYAIFFLSSRLSFPQYPRKVTMAGGRDENVSDMDRYMGAYSMETSHPVQTLETAVKTTEWSSEG